MPFWSLLLARFTSVGPVAVPVVTGRWRGCFRQQVRVMSQPVHYTVTSGHVERSKRMNRFDCMYVLHPPALALPQHAHHHTAIWIVLEGELSQRIGRQDQRAKRGATVIVPENEPHADLIGSESLRSLILAVPDSTFAELGGSAREPRVLLEAELLSLATRMRRELPSGDTASLLILEGLGLELIGRFLRGSFSTVGQPQWLSNVIERIRAEFLTPLTLGDIADGAGVHPVYLARAFRKWTGESVGQLVRRLRIEYAARELTKGTESVAAISAAAGFSDQAHFCRAFRKQMNVTPSAFRQTHRLP